MRFGFTLDGYEILAVKKLVKTVPVLAKAWARFESNHYKKHIRYEVSDVMLHVRLPWLYHTNLWLCDHCRVCGRVLCRVEVARKSFKAMTQHCHPDGQMLQVGNEIWCETMCMDCCQHFVAA